MWNVIAKKNIVFLFCLILVSAQGAAMSIFIKSKDAEATLFSPLSGKIFHNGKPAANANIRLWIKWKDKEGETFNYLTDENGYFDIPLKKVDYKDNPLAQIVITQEIKVDYNNETYLIWSLGRTRTEEYSELGGRPVNLTCELNDELEPHRQNGILLATSCKWDSIEKVQGE